MKPSNRAEKEARLRERNAEIAALVRQAEEEAAALRAVPDYDERRRQGIREVRRLAQWLRALAIAEDDANDRPLRELVAQTGLDGGAWPVEVRKRVAAVIGNPPRPRRGLGRQKVDAADRAAMRTQMDAARRVYDENRRLASSIADSAQCEVEEILRTLEGELAQQKEAIAARHGLTVGHVEKLTVRRGRKSSKSV